MSSLLPSTARIWSSPRPPPMGLAYERFYLQTEGKAERVGFEPTRRLNTAYAISSLKEAPYQFLSGAY
jgi:hypothetical protein